MKQNVTDGKDTPSHPPTYFGGPSVYEGFCGGTAGAPLCAANRESSSCWWENIQSAARSRLLLVSLRERDACSLVKPMDMSIAKPSSLGVKLSPAPADGNDRKVFSA